MLESTCPPDRDVPGPARRHLTVVRRVLALSRTPLLLAAGLVAAGLVLRSLPTGGADLGVWARQQGPAWFVLTAALACAVGVPRQAACFAAGYAFGPLVGGGLALLAETVSCVADVIWARAIARRWVRQRLGKRLARLDRMLVRRPFGATLSLRLMPVGNNLLLNLAAGVSGVALLPFVLASAVGYLPQTAVFVLLGAGIGIGTEPQLVLGGVLFVLSAALGFGVLRASLAEERRAAGG